MSPRPLTVVRTMAAGVAISRLARAADTRPAVQRGAGGRDDGSISVVIPARDEARRIGPLLEALADADVDEVIVVDDESTDDTARIASAHGATVVAGRALPSGWVGKPWALHQGLEAASGDWIVSFDADVRFDAALPRALVARAVADGTDLLSVAGRFECPTAGVRWLHPAMLTTFVYRFGPPGAATSPLRAVANGQCMVFGRERLLSEGGLTIVADQHAEDVALARVLARRGWSVDFLDGTELLTVRMYESLADTWAGWGRSLGLPGVESIGRQLGELVVLGVSLPLPMLRLLARRFDPVDGVLLAARVGTLVGIRRAYDRTDVAYWASPLADAAAVAAVAASGVRRRQVWRGRRYEPD